jgi:hypothetical protein
MAVNVAVPEQSPAKLLGPIVIIPLRLVVPDSEVVEPPAPTETDTDWFATGTPS